MVVDEEQEFYINELIYNTEAINDILEDITFNEINDEGESFDNQYCYEVLNNLLKEENDIINQYVFTRDFIKILKFHMEEGLSKCTLDEQRISKRIIKLLSNKLLGEKNYNYSIDIYLIAFSLLEEYIENTKSEQLKSELIKIKYDVALFKPELTSVFLERNFNFKNNIYVFPESYNFIYENNVFDDNFYETIIELYSKDLLMLNNEDIYDVEGQAKLFFLYSMIKSASFFLKEPLTWEYFEGKFDLDTANEYFINLLKSLVSSNEGVLKRINLVTLKR